MNQEFTRFDAADYLLNAEDVNFSLKPAHASGDPAHIACAQEIVARAKARWAREAEQKKTDQTR